MEPEARDWGATVMVLRRLRAAGPPHKRPDAGINHAMDRRWRNALGPA